MKTIAWDFETTVYLLDDDIEVTIQVRGHQDPGYTSGPPEDCYPPDEDEEREIKALKVFGIEVPLTEDAIKKIQDWVDQEDISRAKSIHAEAGEWN